MYKFEDVFKRMTKEEIKEFEDEMEMSVNDFLMEVEANPLVAAIAEILLNVEIGDKIAERG